MSPFFTVTKKELQDHFNSWRFAVLLLIIITGVIYVYLAAGAIRSAASGSPGSGLMFLSLFTVAGVNTSSNLLPASFLSLMSILIPIAGILLGLDAINKEKNNGTLSRLVSQPIYRDNIINAKFFAGIITISVMLLTSILLACGVGLRIIGIAPSIEEIWRLFFFLVIGIVYGGFWLGLAILFSTIFKQVAVSAVLSIVIWIFFAFFYPLIYTSMVNQADTVAKIQHAITVARISPIYLFNESMDVTLLPLLRSSSQMVMVLSTDLQNYLLATPLSLIQSLLAVWPQIIITIVLTVICFVIAYVKFMFEEIRSL